MKIHGLWTLILLMSSFHALSQDSDIDDKNLDEIEAITSSNSNTRKSNLNNQSRSISLRDIIEEGLRQSSFQQVRDFSKEILEIEWKDNYRDFWYPQLSLNIKTNDTLVDNLYGDVNDNQGTTKTPNGSVGLGFDNYTIFNWGRDYLVYLNNEESYKKRKRNFREQRRALRFEIISQYFNVIRAKEITKVKKNQLRQTSFIYRLTKEKMSLKKVYSQQFLQAKSEFLKAHSEYQDSLYNIAEAEQELARLIGDELTTSYSPTEQLKFKTLTTLKETSYKFALDKNPEFLDSQAILKNSNRTFTKSLKDNMPLPKFDVKLGTYQHNFSNAGANDTLQTSPNNKNVEIVASINMKWKIFGSGGLFNSHRNQTAYLNKRIAEIEYRQAKKTVNVNVNSLHRKIRYLEKQYEANAALLKNMKITFDKTLDNYISGKTSFANMKLVLELMVKSQEDVENSKYYHLVNKLELARLMGMDDFPGESFEGLVIR